MKKHLHIETGPGKNIVKYCFHPICIAGENSLVTWAQSLNKQSLWILYSTPSRGGLATNCCCCVGLCLLVVIPRDQAWLIRDVHTPLGHYGVSVTASWHVVWCQCSVSHTTQRVWKTGKLENGVKKLGKKMYSWSKVHSSAGLSFLLTLVWELYLWHIEHANILLLFDSSPSSAAYMRQLIRSAYFR